MRRHAKRRLLRSKAWRPDGVKRARAHLGRRCAPGRRGASLADTWGGTVIQGPSKLAFVRATAAMKSAFSPTLRVRSLVQSFVRSFACSLAATSSGGASALCWGAILLLVVIIECARASQVEHRKHSRFLSALFSRLLFISPASLSFPIHSTHKFPFRS